MSGFGDVVRTVAPAIASVLGGPLAGAAVSFLADKLGVSGATQDKIQEILAGTNPVELKRLDYEFQMFMAANGIKIDLAQIDVNRTEASNTSLFVSGWRPFVGWACGFAFVYSYILLPFLMYLAFTFGTAETVKQLAQLPALDLGAMLPVLFGMLGLGYMRTQEKINGVKSGH